MNPIAQKVSEASVIMEGTPHPEIAELLRLASNEIDRLDKLVEAGKESVWVGRRFYFTVMGSPKNTSLAIVFNDILAALGQTSEEGKARHARFYPPSPENGFGDAVHE